MGQPCILCEAASQSTYMKPETIPMRRLEESPHMAALADAFVPLLLAMINDPNIIFSRPSELRFQRGLVALTTKKK